MIVLYMDHIRRQNSDSPSLNWAASGDGARFSIAGRGGRSVVQDRVPVLAEGQVNSWETKLSSIIFIFRFELD